MYSPIPRSIVLLAVLSRIIIVLLQFVANILIPDHDAGVFISPTAPDTATGKCDRFIEIAVGGFRRWDAEYFLHIAEHGYTYENTLAFYPLFPMIVRYSTYSLQSIVPIVNQCSFHHTLLLVALLLNVVFFVKATCTLFALVESVCGKRRIARIAALLFCFNPASIFFSAPYSESLFCWLSFSVMLSCIRSRFTKATLTLSASILCRSNGFLNVGFVAYFLLKDLCRQNQLHIMKLLTQFIKLLIVLIIAGLSFALVHIYYYLLYCTEYKVIMTDSVRVYAEKHNLVMAGNTNNTSRISSPWCVASIPMSYSYIQSHYWNVGFLNYYELKQVPNFLLATPILFLILCNAAIYFSKNPRVILRLGLIGEKGSEAIANQFVFVVHAFILAVFCTFFVHIQVSTRMLASSSPCLYMFSARYLHNDNEFDMKDFAKQITSLWTLSAKSRKSKTVSLWFVSYYTIGTVLFCNFLPWT